MRSFTIFLVFWMLAGALHFTYADAYEETHKKRSWFSLGRPHEKSPAAQLAYAEELEQSGKMDRAADEYKLLVREWPESREAPTAQYEYARILHEKGKKVRAFDAFKELLSDYSIGFPYDDVLERMFDTAVYVMHARKGKFLFFPGFPAPERAVPYFEAIIEFGPESRWAPESQYLIGIAYDQSHQYELAIAAYTAAQYRYPNSPFAEKAAFAKAYDLFLLSRESVNDEAALQSAWAALTVFINSYPDSELIPEAIEYREVLYQRRARDAFQQAKYYDIRARKPEAALISYQRFIQEFPHSGWTSLAEIRIQELQRELAKKDAGKTESGLDELLEDEQEQADEEESL